MDPNIAAELKSMGVRDIILKPYKLIDIHLKIREVLGGGAWLPTCLPVIAPGP
jgi:DNA-binding NarL/FixJ family response regulator